MSASKDFNTFQNIARVKNTSDIFILQQSGAKVLLKELMECVHVHNKKDTGNINISVDFIKQRFENISKPSKGQEQSRHFHSSQSGTKVFLK